MSQPQNLPDLLRARLKLGLFNWGKRTLIWTAFLGIVSTLAPGLRFLLVGWLVFSAISLAALLLGPEAGQRSQKPAPSPPSPPPSASPGTLAAPAPEPVDYQEDAPAPSRPHRPERRERRNHRNRSRSAPPGPEILTGPSVRFLPGAVKGLFAIPPIGMHREKPIRPTFNGRHFRIAGRLNPLPILQAIRNKDAILFAGDSVENQIVKSIRSGPDGRRNGHPFRHGGEGAG